MGSVEGWVYQMEVMIVEEERAVLEVNLGRPIVTNRDGDALFPNYFGRIVSICTKLTSLLVADVHDINISSFCTSQFNCIRPTVVITALPLPHPPGRVQSIVLRLT